MLEIVLNRVWSVKSWVRCSKMSDKYHLRIDCISSNDNIYILYLNTHIRIMRGEELAGPTHDLE